MAPAVTVVFLFVFFVAALVGYIALAGGGTTSSPQLQLLSLQTAVATANLPENCLSFIWLRVAQPEANLQLQKRMGDYSFAATDIDLSPQKRKQFRAPLI